MSNPALSSWARNVAPSPTLAVDAKAKALKAAGKDVVGFGVGEPDFDTPQFIKDACAKALADGQTKYAPTPGIPALRKAIAEDYTRRGFTGIADANVVVSPGGKMSCYLAILATISSGDEVIIPAPYWVSYPEMVKLAGGKPVVVNAEDVTGFKITPAQLTAALTPKTRMVIINSPSNPTGAVYSRAELEALVAICVQANVWIMSDEIYENLVYDGQTTCSPATFSPEAARLTITVSGYAKSYSMTGWRLGWCVIPEAMVPVVERLAQNFYICPPTPAQFAALACFTPESIAVCEARRSEFAQRRAQVIAGLAGIGLPVDVPPDGAFYAWFDVRHTGLDAWTFCQRALQEAHVALTPGRDFSELDPQRHVRLSCAASTDDLTEGLSRLGRFVADL